MSVSINHVAMYVHDLEASRGFYETYFGATANDQYHNPKTGLRTYFLSFDGPVRLEIMTRPGVEDAGEGLRMGWNHTAFSLGTREAVDALADRLRGDGFTIANGPRVTGDGYYEAVVIDPDGNQVEITA